MKKQSITILALLLYIYGQGAQDYEAGKLWLRTTDSQAIPVFNAQGEVTNAIHQDILQVLDQYQVAHFKQAFPLAEQINPNTDLKNVYTVSCNCDENLLKNAIDNTLSNYYYKVEKIPGTPIPLHEPNDYNGTVSSLGFSFDEINVREAWDITTGDPNITVAVLDHSFKPRSL